MSNPNTLARSLLEKPWWPQGIEANTRYFRTQDDCDGDHRNGITVAIGEDGDVWVHTTHVPWGSCRFRMPMLGGGLSPRVRNALLLLALAIKLDNEERPIQ